MSQIFTRRCIGSRHSYAGRDWWYEFGDEMRAFEERRVAKYIARQQRAYAKLAKNWDDDCNTEWTCRVFFSAKMVLAASVMLSSLEFSKQKNLRICAPYLQYYSLLYSLKSLILLLPSQEWKNGELVKQTHTKTINIACDEMFHLDASWKEARGDTPSVKQSILRLKGFRELISYRAPSSGGSLAGYAIDVLPLCRTAVEVAQMTSEILEESMSKHLPAEYEPKILLDDLVPVYRTSQEGFEYFDDEDYHRIEYLRRKHPFPASVLHIMSEGHVEDFFGSWCNSENCEGVYDPNVDWGILFDVP